MVLFFRFVADLLARDALIPIELIEFHGKLDVGDRDSRAGVVGWGLSSVEFGAIAQVRVGCII